MRIDAHQHFWAVERGDYDWLTPELTPLYRDFQPSDLTPHLSAHGIDGTVLVQAAPTVAETEYMLGIAAQNAFVKGVVGWVDFEADDAQDQIERLSQNARLVGLRPMIQNIPDPDWMLRESLTPAFTKMVELGLVFDALTLPHHLSNLLVLLARHPNLKVVIDHGSKPDIAARKFEDWAENMTRLGAESSAYVKLSGLVTEAGPLWSHNRLRPYVDHLLSAFGPSRVIWGSDWPVCTMASTYERWCTATIAFLAGLSAHERAAIWGGNAVTLYGLEQQP